MGGFGKYIREFRNYPRWLKILLPSSGLFFAASLITQMILFPDNPIVPHDGGYFGKYGAAHTREEFQLFTWMNRAILLGGLAFFAAFFSTLIYAVRKSGNSDNSSR